jgi:hypothetical protein
MPVYSKQKFECEKCLLYTGLTVYHLLLNLDQIYQWLKWGIHTGILFKIWLMM